MNKEALFTDETGNFRIPAEADAGQQVTFRFRTARNDVKEVFFVERDEEPKRMWRGGSDALFDYYEYHMIVPDYPVNYHFLAVNGDKFCCYNRLGADLDSRRQFDFCLTPGFHTPDWAKGAVMYQIFVDRFRRGAAANDVVDNEYIYVGVPVKYVADWDSYPANMDVGRFYGGDLQGVRDKLDYIRDLGVEVIYFNPLFVSPSNHKYDTQDYDHIDPHYGVIVKDGGEPVAALSHGNRDASKYRIRTAAPENLTASDRFFADFVAEAHAKGLRVIIDGVFNHCGSFNKWLDREGLYGVTGLYEPGAYADKDSPYRTFFKFGKENAWPDNASYEGWWNYETLPKLNYEESPKLYDYILQIARKWVSPPFCVDGWRLDVAADLGHSSEFNHRFWRDFRRAVKEANPDALILAEHYGDPTPWLEGDQWDTIMNYDSFMEPLTWFLTGMEKHSDEYNPNLFGDGEAFFRSMYYYMSRMQMPSILTSMNELSNHDHSRFMTRTNRTPGRVANKGPEAAEQGIHKGIFREAVVVQMTWPGAPTVYYGDETGLCGWTDPDNRRTYPWGHEDQEMIEFHRYMISLHRMNGALRHGSLKELAAGRQLIAYGRFDADNRCVIAVNNSASSQTVSLPVWQLGIEDSDRLTRLIKTDTDGYNVGAVDLPVVNGFVELPMDGNSAVLLVSNKSGCNLEKTS